MEIEMRYLQKETNVYFRALRMKTRLKQVCVQKIAQKHMASRASLIKFFETDDRKFTTFEIDLEDAQVSSFAGFLYQVMNWEGNHSHWR
jgi:hypothetical protein